MLYITHRALDLIDPLDYQLVVQPDAQDRNGGQTSAAEIYRPCLRQAGRCCTGLIAR